MCVRMYVCVYVRVSDTQQTILPKLLPILVCPHTHARLNYVLYTNLHMYGPWYDAINYIDIIGKYVCIERVYVFFLFEYCAIITHTFSIADVFGLSPKVRVEINSIARVCVKTSAYFVANTNVCLI